MGPGGRRGRIDNGLVAAEYAAAGDVDPRVGEHLLDVLGAGGIAAYLAPSSDLHPVTRTTTIPDRPTDRLFVDRAHVQTAREYIRQLAAADAPAPVPTTPEEAGIPAAPAAKPGEPRDPTAAPPPPTDGDVDTMWARIIAGYDSEVAEPRRTWPESENLADRDDENPQSLADRSGHPAGTGLVKSDYAERSLLDGLDTFGAHLPDEETDTEGYTPPPPPPLPRPSRIVVLAVVGIVAGLLLFLRPAFLPVAEDLGMVLGLSMILAGFVALIWRLRPGTEEDEDDDPDHGAVV